MPGWGPDAWEECQARAYAVDEAVPLIKDEGYFMDRHTEQLCEAFIAGRFTPDDIINALAKSRQH